MKWINKIVKFLITYLKYYKLSLLVLVLTSLFSGFGTVAATLFLQFAINSVNANDFATTSLICGILIAYYACNWLVQFFQYSVNAKMSQKISKKIRNDIFTKLNNLSIKYFDENQTGDIMSRFINDVNNITVLLSDNFADLVGVLVWLFGIGIAIFIISWQLSLITIFLFIIAIIIVSFRIKKSLPYFKDLQDEIASFTSFLEEKIAGQSIIDLFEQQKLVKKEFDKIQYKVAQSWSDAQLQSFYTYPIIEFVTNIITICIYSIGILFIILNINFATINITSGQSGSEAALIIFTLLSRNFLSPLSQLPPIINVALGAKVGVERVEDILDRKDEYNEIEKVAITLSMVANNVTIDNYESNHKTLKPKVEFQKVGFGYLANKKVLKDVSFKIEPGQFIGIVGPTGSGKSTIISLLAKLYDVDDGDILIDDVSIKIIDKKSFRNNVSLVLQDTFFFDLSIKENIKLSNPNATDEQIYFACQKACCHDLILALPNGYDTVISSFSEQLSKGQKQLIAIARAMISEANLVIFDEATSSVDVKTETKIQLAMEELLKNKTAIVIAHRLSTVRNADKILVIKEGKLIEEGTHSELIAQNGFYANLYNSQFDLID